MNTDRAGATRGTGRDIDDTAPLLRAHRRQNGLRAEKRRFQVYGNGLIEVAFGEVIDASNDRQPGVVDENVDGTQRRACEIDHLRDGDGLRYVGGDPGRTATEFPDLRDNRF